MIVETLNTYESYAQTPTYKTSINGNGDLNVLSERFIKQLQSLSDTYSQGNIQSASRSGSFYGAERSLSSDSMSASSPLPTHQIYSDLLKLQAVQAELAVISGVVSSAKTSMETLYKQAG